MVKKRNPKVDGAVREAIAEILEEEFSDPRLKFITITEVEVTQDMKRAIVYYTTLDPDVLARDPSRTGGDRLPEAHEAAAGLDSARARIQSLLAARVRLRNTPKLEFVPDPVAEQASKVESLLADLRREDGS